MTGGIAGDLVANARGVQIQKPPLTAGARIDPGWRQDIGADGFSAQGLSFNRDLRF